MRVRPFRYPSRQAVTLERILTMSAVRLYLVAKIGGITQGTDDVRLAAKERDHGAGQLPSVAEGAKGGARW